MPSVSVAFPDISASEIWIWEIQVWISALCRCRMDSYDHQELDELLMGPLAASPRLPLGELVGCLADEATLTSHTPLLGVPHKCPQY